MNYANHPQGAPLELRRTPWLVFLFLAAVFFLIYHDVAYSKKGVDNYNPSEEDIATGVAEGSLAPRIALLSLGFFAIISLTRRRTTGLLRIRGSLGGILLLFVAWAFLSAVWTEDMALTLRRLVVFGIFCLAAAAMASRFSVREIVLLTLFLTAVFLVIAISAELFLGTFRPFASNYRFAGTIDPNTQGVNCALLVLSGVAAADAEKRRRRFFLICALFGFVFLILTGSRTSFAAGILALATYFAAVLSKRGKIVLAYSLGIAFSLILLFFANGLLPNLKAAILLGREDGTGDSFNGRTGIWEDVGFYILQRPILGYGYGGFWTPEHISEISKEEKWGVPNSHSAYLDYLLTLGAVGLFAYALLLFGGIWSAFRFQRLSQNSAFAFCGALLIFCVMDGFLESAVASPSFLMFLCWIVLASLALKGMPRSEFVQHSPAPGLSHGSNG